MIKFTRARVALTTSVPDPARHPSSLAYDHEMTHIAHTRTLLIGSLIAKEKGIPFHVRFDGNVVDGVDRLAGVLDAVNCLNWLGIEYDKIYWTPQIPTPHEVIVQKFGGERASQVQSVVSCGSYTPPSYVATMFDDFVDYHPSLIIRGLEFKQPSVYFHSANAASSAQHVRHEDAICSALGVEKQELNLPMMLMGREKMSKSRMAIVHWSVLQMVSPEQARNFLLRTATQPNDPLRTFVTPFTSDMIKSGPFTWSWELWAEYVRRCGGGS